MFKFKEHQKYAQIDSEYPDGRKSRYLCRYPIGCVLLSVFSVSCLIIGLVVVIYHNQRPGSEHERITECGASLAEFEANGCVFDILSYAWMPARCIDKATSEEFQSWLSDPQRILGPWPFFKEVSGGSSPAENRISSAVEFGNRLDMDIWSTMEEHLAHCMFMFLHASRVALGEAPLWSTDSYPHANHCFQATWKGLNGTWNFYEDSRANHKITIGVSTC
ncbi:hypothetical protein BS50DRAFT_593919 [Corynespora cassiicola Philippines]|uniref:Uncharacterized protein n=1 Tax=Corynespora cassiicola Philippines TaxID=1448308 RepID=A0A2T2N549_CORCC|nr:hypothetical protein BS50DRAFT_593919 [Corynespora cassiicola Philippines]